MSGLTKREVSVGILLSIYFLLFTAGANQASAQAITPKPNAESFNWKSGSEAISQLMAQVQVLEQQLPGMTEGTPLHDNTLRRIAYFKAIAAEVDRGASVSTALDLAIPAAATLGFSKEASYTPKITLRALYTETRILLTY